MPSYISRGSLGIGEYFIPDKMQTYHFRFFLIEMAIYGILDIGSKLRERLTLGENRVSQSPRTISPIGGLLNHEKQFIHADNILSSGHFRNPMPCSRANAAAFELDYEANLVAFLDEINAGTYRVGRSLAFIVEQPVKREVFAADFRDRVVHHLLINKINPLLEREFICDDMVLVHQDRAHPPTREERSRFRSGINSYLGILRHYATYRLRHSLLGRINSWWRRLFSCGGSAEKVMIRGGS